MRSFSRKYITDKFLCFLKKEYDIFILFLVNIVIIITSLKVNTFYIIPYRDMIIGIYPPSRIVDLLLSPWTPENFGMLSSLPPSYILMYVLETLLPPAKAFAIYTIFPYVITSIVAYYSLSQLLPIKDKKIKLLLTLLYTYNWLTIYLYGSSLVIYTYASGLLYLLSLYNIYVHGLKERHIVELIVSLSLALFAWNLPGLILILYLTIPIIIMCIITLSLRKLLSLIKVLTKSIILTVLIFMPFVYAKIVGMLSEGIFGYALRAGYLISGENWLKTLMPVYFEMYLGTVLKVLLIFIDPLLSNVCVTFLAITILTIILLYMFRREKKKYKLLKLFFLSNVIYVLALYLLIATIISRSSAINVLYNNFVILSALKTATNYMVILAPSIFIIYAIGITRLKNSMLKYTITIALVMMALFSHNGLIFNISNLEHVNSVTIGGINYNIIKIPDNIVNLFNKINNERGWSYRVLWLPLYRGERSAFSSTPEDLPVSKTSDILLAKYYDILLRSLLSDSTEGSYAVNYLLRMFGIKYIVLLKNINDTRPPSVTYFGYSPVGLEGNYRAIKKILDKKMLKLIESNKYYALYKCYNNISYFNAIRITRNYTIFSLLNNIDNNDHKVGNVCTIRMIFNNESYKDILILGKRCRRYEDYYFIKFNSTDSIDFKFDKSLARVLEKHTTLTIDSTIVYYKTNTLFSNIINIGGGVRVLIRSNGQLLVQYHMSKGYINQFSKARLIPGQVYNVIVFINQTRSLLFIDGVLDSAVTINNTFTTKNDNIIIGFDGNYPYKGYIGNINIIVGTSDKFNIYKYVKKRLISLYFNFNYIASKDIDVVGTCLRPYECSIRINSVRLYPSLTIMVPFKLDNYWYAESPVCSSLKIIGFDGMSIIKLNNCSSHNIVIRLSVARKYVVTKYLSIIVSIAMVIYFVKKCVSLALSRFRIQVN